MRRLALLLLALLVVAPARAAQPAAMVTTGCQEHEAVVDGDAAAVATRLPAGFTPVQDFNGAPLIVAHAIRCDAVTVDGHTAAATLANVGILIQSPDGVGCASGAPVEGSIKGDVPPACNWYSLSWLADNHRVARWLHAACRHDMTFSPGAFDPALGGAPFHFTAPGAFAIDDVSRPRPGEISVRGAYWTAGLRLGIASDDISAGDATGTLSAPPGSEVATLMGATQRGFVPGYDAVAAVTWRTLTYTRQPR